MTARRGGRADEVPPEEEEEEEGHRFIEEAGLLGRDSLLLFFSLWSSKEGCSCREGEFSLTWEGERRWREGRPGGEGCLEPLPGLRTVSCVMSSLRQTFGRVFLRRFSPMISGAGGGGGKALKKFRGSNVCGRKGGTPGGATIRSGGT